VFKTSFATLLILWFSITSALAAGNGKLQIHFIDVGQGDSAILISPQGESVMFDDGNSKSCEKPLAYIESLGISSVDYHVATHYHSDHIGCASEIFSQIKVKTAAYDRGQSYATSDYKKYIAEVKTKRSPAKIGQTIVLDKSSDNPVKITFVAVNASTGDTIISTTNENDLSISSLIEFGNFRAEISGDLSGEDTGDYKDIETPVSKKVGRLDVYKVHHHCSAYSTNEAWLGTTKPTVGIISVGVENNTYGHPAENCLDRLHRAGVKLYLTEEGKGAKPDLHSDKIAGSVIVEVLPKSKTYKVSYQGNRSDEYLIASSGDESISGPATASTGYSYAWAKSSSIFHDASCPVVKNIKSENLVLGDTPPNGRAKHNCPDNH
jgi:beta-lactamase superfamily II metal-dependent hydrolase